MVREALNLRFPKRPLPRTLPPYDLTDVAPGMSSKVYSGWCEGQAMYSDSSVKQSGRLKAFRVVRAVKDRSLTALNTSQFTDGVAQLATP
jgi:hypothetical protein